MSQERVQENWRVIHRFAAVNFCLLIGFSVLCHAPLLLLLCREK